MRGRLVPGLILAGFLGTAASPALATDPPPAGAWARYEVVEGPAERPNLTELRLSVPVHEIVDGERWIWFQLEAFTEGEPLYSIALRVPSIDFLFTQNAVPVTRYVVFPADETALEFVDRNTGMALLPRFSFFEEALPRAASEQPPFFGEGVYLGRTLRLVESGTGASILPLIDARRLELDPEVLVGTSRHFRDDGSGQRPGERGGRADYRYVDLSRRDYARMMEAGMNVFRVPGHHLPFVIEEPVFFLALDRFQERPEILYRSNFLGAVMYMDEPAARLLNRGELAHAATPAEAAATVTRVTRERWEGSEKYGQRHLDQLLRAAGYDFGREVLQADYPVWEAVASSAWYELEAGVPGWCYEGRFEPERFAELMKDHLGVDFPADPAATLAFHYALFTGAARRFDARWGVSVYGQMEAETARLAFPRAYDVGATYFWFWTSDRSHHVPFERQLELAREFREYRERAPRQYDARDLTSAAEVAIALPWGYLGPEAWLPVPGGARDGRLWGSDRLALDATTAGGATYRDVLRAAVETAVRQWEANNPFDFVFLHPDEEATGYRRVFRVLETGDVVEQ